ncbi:MAG: M23 family metallopeptidase [Bacteriovoracaceae bacterium]|nr:M23 family metallopeptidase [Bacteriovoracaceae bacterium]
MKYLLFLLMMNSACATSVKVEPMKPGELVTVESQPGFVRWVSFPVQEGWENATLQCKDQKLKHAPLGQGMRFAYIAETYHSDLSAFKCKLIQGKEEREVIDFSIKPFKYKEEKLKVPFRTIKLSKTDLARAQREQRMLAELYTKSAALPYFNQPFIAPLDSYITSIYGNRRVYNNAHKSQHLGTDFRAAIGVPVPATNRGRVLFAGDLFYTGGTVIIDHGMDIFSVYGHLSEVKVQEGQVVNRGDIVALSGNTGRSSGPHLHWGVKIHGDYVNGYSLIDESKKQFP